MVFPGCFDRLIGQGKMVDLRAGQLILFRGDLLHCGVGYDVENYRLHCYVTVPDRLWVPDVVTSASTRLYQCKFCELNFPDSIHARRHQYICVDNPKHAEHIVALRRSETGSFQCPFCTHKPFKTRRGYRKHRNKHMS